MIEVALPVKIRRYQDSDLNNLAELYRDFFNEMREWQGWEKLKLSHEEAVETAKDSLRDNSWVFVAEDKGKLIGFARLQFWDGAYFIREGYVAQSWRRKGVGSKLLSSCEDLVRKKGETSIYLTVEPKHHKSLKFLIHNGYDTLNMLELRKDFEETDMLMRQGEADILGHKLRLLKRKTRNHF